MEIKIYREPKIKDIPPGFTLAIEIPRKPTPDNNRTIYYSELFFTDNMIRFGLTAGTIIGVAIPIARGLLGM